MRCSFNFLNLEIGFFFRRRYSINGFFKKIKFSKVDNNINNPEITKGWEYSVTPEKRLRVLTGCDNEKGMLHWLYRDVDRVVISASWTYDKGINKHIYTPEFSLEPIYGVLSAVDNWRDNLIKCGCNEKQIDFYNKTSSKLFLISIKRIKEVDKQLFKYINKYFSNDKRYTDAIIGEEF